jgi:hypothetical protein
MRLFLDSQDSAVADKDRLAKEKVRGVSEYLPSAMRPGVHVVSRMTNDFVLGAGVAGI